MRIIFVRHGEPDYANDCLTQTGRQQAAAVARRLAGEGISEIYTSPCGRAAETASYTAARLRLPVTTLDFMREITWGGEGVPCDGHPWTLGDRMLAEGFDFKVGDWRAHPYFAGNAATVHCENVAVQLEDKTIALFSHGGSGACALAHLLNLPFPYVASVLPYDFTSIIILDFPVCEGAYVFPRVELFNDCAHIRRHAGGPALQQKSER